VRLCMPAGLRGAGGRPSDNPALIFRSDRLCTRREHSGRPCLLPAALGAHALPLLHAGLLRGGLRGRAADHAVEQHAPRAQPLLHLHHLQLHARPDLARARMG